MAKLKNTSKHKRLTAAEKFALRVAHRCELLAPQLPDIEQDDLELIVAEQLKTPEERKRVMFLQQYDEGFVSFNSALLAKLAEALAHAELEALMFDDFTAIESGASAPKKKTDLLVHDHKGLQSKLKKFERAFGVARLRPNKSSPQVVRAVGRLVSVNFLFADSDRRNFNSITARAKRISFGTHELNVTTREDLATTESATH